MEQGQQFGKSAPRRSLQRTAIIAATVGTAIALSTVGAFASVTGNSPHVTTPTTGTTTPAAAGSTTGAPAPTGGISAALTPGTSSGTVQLASAHTTTTGGSQGQARTVLGVTSNRHRTTTPTTTPAPTTTTVPPTTSTTVPPSSPTTIPFAEGAYVGPAAPSALASFASTTSTHPTIASDYLPASSGWSGMDGAGGSLSWLTGPWASTGDTLSLGVPMIPTNASGSPLGTLAAGATGAYNGYFTTLAQTLVAAGDTHAYLRLGWEFDGNWYAWDAQSAADEANYASYFDQIVTAMRAVPGASFSFVWNPDASAFVGQSVNPNYNVSLAYPGNAYVDVIGLDLYDQTWATPQTPATAWAQSTSPALAAAHAFASAHGKPLALCEWGIAIRSDGHGLGDDPTYVNNMLSFMEAPANDVTYESYFDYNTLPVGGDTNAQITGGSFPHSLAAFVQNLG